MTRDIPGTMKAAAVDRFGPPSALTVRDVPVPRPGPHEVLIAIDTAGIGSWDASIRDGSWRKPGRPRFPLVPGVDGAGIVVAKGARVRRIRLRERVYAYEFGNRQGGFYAQYAAAAADHVGRVPKGLELRDAGPRAFDKLSRYLGNGGIRVPVTATYPLGKVAQAHRRLERGQVPGRMVLQVPRGRH